MTLVVSDTNDDCDRNVDHLEGSRHECRSWHKCRLRRNRKCPLWHKWLRQWRNQHIPGISVPKNSPIRNNDNRVSQSSFSKSIIETDSRSTRAEHPPKYVERISAVNESGSLSLLYCTTNYCYVQYRTDKQISRLCWTKQSNSLLKISLLPLMWSNCTTFECGLMTKNRKGQHKLVGRRYQAGTGNSNTRSRSLFRLSFEEELVANDVVCESPDSDPPESGETTFYY